MQRQFKPDGSLTGAPEHSPLWNPAWESRSALVETTPAANNPHVVLASEAIVSATFDLSDVGALPACMADGLLLCT